MNEFEKHSTGDRKLTRAELNEKEINDKLNAENQAGKQGNANAADQDPEIPPQEQTIGIP